MSLPRASGYFRSGYEQGFNDGERYGDSGGFRWPF